MNLQKWSRWNVFFAPDGDGGTPPVTTIDVPAPGSDDIDDLGGEDDDTGEEEEEGEESGNEDGEEEEGTEKPVKKEKADPDAFDVEDDEEGKTDEDEGDDEEEGEGKKKGSKEDKDDVEEEETTFRKLRKVDPEIFKKVPELRKTLGEHQQFKAIFTTPEEAKEVAAQADNFNTFSELVMNADLKTFFDEVEREDKTIVDKWARGFLGEIKERNRDLYLDVTEGPIKDFINYCYKKGNSGADKTSQNLKNSAMYLWGQLTGKVEAPTENGRSNEPSAREKEFEEKIKKDLQDRATDAGRTVNTTIYSQLHTRVENMLDPGKKGLKETTRNALVKHIIAEIDSEVVKDENHKAKTQRLWQQARRSSFSQGHLSRIIDAYLERAKSIMSKHVKKVRAENGLKDDSGKGSERREGQHKELPPRPNSGGQSRGRTLRDVNPRQIDYSRTSDEDILAGRARTKK